MKNQGNSSICHASAPSTATSKYPPSSPPIALFPPSLFLGLANPLLIFLIASNVACSLVWLAGVGGLKCPLPFPTSGDLFAHPSTLPGLGPFQLVVRVSICLAELGRVAGVLGPCGGLAVGSANSSTTWLPLRDSYVFCMARRGGMD